MDRFGENQAILLKRVFAFYERGRPSPVLFEWDGVFRVGNREPFFGCTDFIRVKSKSEFIVVERYAWRATKLVRRIGKKLMRCR